MSIFAEKKPQKCRINLNIFSLSLNTSAWPGEGAFLSTFCSAWQHGFGRRGKSLWAVEIYNCTLLISPSTSAEFLCKKGCPTRHGEATDILRLISTAHKHGTRAKIILSQLKMKSVCAYLRFDTELNFNGAPCKQFQIKEVNFILYFQFQKQHFLNADVSFSKRWRSQHI